MPTTDEFAPQHTDAAYYGFFMTGLLGLLDDAELSGYSAAGVAHLRRAREEFWREFQTRHPDAWKRSEPLSTDTQP